MLVAGIQGKSGEQKPPPVLSESRLGTTCQTNSQRAAGGGVCPRGTLDEARSTRRT